MFDQAGKHSTPQEKILAREALQATQLFAALNETELGALAGRSGLRSYQAGAMLFSEGESCEGLYIVVRGRVRIFKTSAAGREQVLTIEGPGASIAELPVFDEGAYPASASAVEASDLLFVPRSGLQAICLEHPQVSLKLLRVVGARLRRLVGIIEELSFTTVRHRLIAWLLREAKAQGRDTERGVTFSLAVSHQELASQIGTVRELVSRNLARLQAQSLIEMNAREITITDQEGLEADLGSAI
jgi:CRP/FNR family cyclic AMP-dependent transcriptional regulator